jgi:hypothetical protein
VLPAEVHRFHDDGPSSQVTSIQNSLNCAITEKKQTKKKQNKMNEIEVIEISN